MTTHSACILTIGDELLHGDVVNTNASWLGQTLRRAGLLCRTAHTVGDRPQDILAALQYLWKDHDLLVLTGGLGPTRDDVTKKVLLHFFDDTLVVDRQVLQHVSEYFFKRGRPMSPVNRGQAEVPSRAMVLFNDLGTAPGLLLEKEGKLLAAMPGVPYELYHIVEKRLIPELKRRWDKSERKVRHHYFRITGIGESELGEQVLGDLDSHAPPSVDVAFLPYPGGVDVRVTEVNGNTDEDFDALLNWIRTRAGSLIFSEDFHCPLGEVVVKLLSEQKKTVAFAESCTGGHMADALTHVPGSSVVFRGAVVAYDNSIKSKLLKVPDELIEKHGAVSAPVALAMARGAGRLLKSDYALSVTGIAGPGGGTQDKPVGTVWIGFWAKSDTGTMANRSGRPISGDMDQAGPRHFACLYRYSSEREINKKRSAAAAMEILRRKLLALEGLPHHPLEVVSSNPRTRPGKMKRSS